MADESSPEEGEYHLVGGSGLAHAWKRFARNFQLPVIAWGGRTLYRVMVRGSDFYLPIEGGLPVIGFITTRYVSARDREDAEEQARRLVWREWRGIGGFGARTLDPAPPVLWMEETAGLQDRLLRDSGGGFTFYSTED